MELEQELHNQISMLKQRQSSSEQHHEGAEDAVMMSIPREGNAEQLNKSTKLTLSSKKQYDNHLQNLSMTPHLNNTQGIPSNYMPGSHSVQG